VAVREHESIAIRPQRVRGVVAQDVLPQRVRDWREINKNLFSALKLERFATPLFLPFVLALALVLVSMWKPRRQLAAVGEAA
jgi:hypothetical protein